MQRSTRVSWDDRVDLALSNVNNKGLVEVAELADVQCFNPEGMCNCAVGDSYEVVAGRAKDRYFNAVSFKCV